MKEIILVFIVGALNLLSFYLGSKTKNQNMNNKEIQINPMKVYKKYKEEKRQDEEKEKFIKEQEQTKIMIENIENYDGTGMGQKDIPV